MREKVNESSRESKKDRDKNREKRHALQTLLGILLVSASIFTIIFISIRQRPSFFSSMSLIFLSNDLLAICQPYYDFQFQSYAFFVLSLSSYLLDNVFPSRCKIKLWWNDMMEPANEKDNLGKWNYFWHWIVFYSWVCFFFILEKSFGISKKLILTLFGW